MSLLKQANHKVPEMRTTTYMLKDLPEGNTMQAGYFSVVHLAIGVFSNSLIKIIMPRKVIKI